MSNDSWLERFETLEDWDDVRLLSRHLGDVVAAAVGDCIEATLVPACELYYALRARGHVKAAAALALHGGGHIHAVETCPGHALGMMVSRGSRTYAVVIEGNECGRPDRMRASLATVGYVAMGALAEAAARALALGTGGDMVFEASGTAWHRGQQDLTWRAGWRMLDDHAVWPDVYASLTEAFAVVGLVGDWQASRADLGHRTYRAGRFVRGEEPAEMLGRDLARHHGLVVDADMQATLAAMSAVYVERAGADVATYLREMTALCLAQGVREEGVRLHMPLVDRVSMADGALHVDVHGGRIRVDLDADATDDTCHMRLSAWPVSEAWRRAPGPVDGMTFAVRYGRARLTSPLNPFGRLVSLFETLRDFGPAWIHDLETAHVP